MVGAIVARAGGRRGGLPRRAGGPHAGRALDAPAARARRRPVRFARALRACGRTTAVRPRSASRGRRSSFGEDQTPRGGGGIRALRKRHHRVDAGPPLRLAAERHNEFRRGSPGAPVRSRQGASTSREESRRLQEGPVDHGPEARRRAILLREVLAVSREHAREADDRCSPGARKAGRRRFRRIVSTPLERHPRRCSSEIGGRPRSDGAASQSAGCGLTSRGSRSESEREEGVDLPGLTRAVAAEEARVSSCGGRGDAVRFFRASRGPGRLFARGCSEGRDATGVVGPPGSPSTEPSGHDVEHERMGSDGSYRGESRGRPSKSRGKALASSGDKVRSGLHPQQSKGLHRRSPVSPRGSRRDTLPRMFTGIVTGIGRWLDRAPAKGGNPRRSGAAPGLRASGAAEHALSGERARRPERPAARANPGGDLRFGALGEVEPDEP